MSFVQHPCMQTVDGFRLLLSALHEHKKTDAYQNLVEQSKKRSEEAMELKRKRDDVRFQLRRGKRHDEAQQDTELAKKYRTGELADICEAAEADYTTRKLQGVAQAIGSR